jgi:hypothetical protein
MTMTKFQQVTPQREQLIIYLFITCQRENARQCCKSHMPFKGKSSFLTPASPKTIHQKEIKIGMVDKVHKFNIRQVSTRHL